MSQVINGRINFTSVKNPLPYPDFLDVQLKSFREFLQLDTPPELRKGNGLYKVFSENFPITDTRNNFVLEFLDYYIDPPRYTIEECLVKGLTYSAYLKAKLKLYCTDPDHEDFSTQVQDVYLGQIPYMTNSGTFIINGAERVVVSQLHRSPGVFFGSSVHANGTQLYSARVIPFKGSWIEFATDINNVMYAYIDRKKKLPVTTLLRAIGFESDKDILEIFNLAEEIKVSKSALDKIIKDAAKDKTHQTKKGEVYRRKLAGRVLKSWTEDFVDEDSGDIVSVDRHQVLYEYNYTLDKGDVQTLFDLGIKKVVVYENGISYNYPNLISLFPVSKDELVTKPEVVLDLLFSGKDNSQVTDEERLLMGYNLLTAYKVLNECYGVVDDDIIPFKIKKEEKHSETTPEEKRVLYLIEEFYDEKINAIMNCGTEKDIMPLFTPDEETKIQLSGFLLRSNISERMINIFVNQFFDRLLMD